MGLKTAIQQKGSNLGEALNALAFPRTTVAAGVAADTNITIAGITQRDLVGSVLAFAGGVPSVVEASTITITGDNTVQCSGDTTGKTLVFTWFKE